MGHRPVSAPVFSRKVTHHFVNTCRHRNQRASAALCVHAIHFGFGILWNLYQFLTFFCYCSNQHCVVDSLFPSRCGLYRFSSVGDAGLISRGGVGEVLAESEFLWPFMATGLAGICRVALGKHELFCFSCTKHLCARAHHANTASA
jgi:hypothetical protein